MNTDSPDYGKDVAKAFHKKAEKAFDPEREAALTENAGATCSNCGSASIVRKRNAATVTVIVVLGLLFFLVGALLALAVPRNAHCGKCGQRRYIA